MVAWGALGLIALWVQGLPGHTVPFFSGDLAYHTGVASTMDRAGLNGTGPYAGMPSYYGGLYPLVLAAVHLAGVDPQRFVMVVSWFEPLLWLLAAAMLARRMWPLSPALRLCFAALLIFGAGVGLPRTAFWVNAPNIAGQVFWPIYPRDIALCLLMVTVAWGLSGRWLPGAIAGALGVVVEVQIGLIACLLLAASLVVVLPRRRAWRATLAAAGTVVALASWWWVPRVVWVLQYGLALADSETRKPLPLSPSTLGEAFGLLLLPAVLGCALWWRERTRMSKAQLLVALWMLASVIVVLTGALLPSPFLSLRRALVLAAIPLAACAIEGVSLFARVFGRPLLREALVPMAVTAVVLAMSVATVLETRSIASFNWSAGVYGMTAYPPSDWDPVWSAVAEGRRPLLAAPADAARSWFATGRPVLFVPRPGYLKVGFDVGRATGWPERARRAAVVAAFLQGGPAVCDLARSRGASEVLVRSEPGRLGLVDATGGLLQQRGMTSPGASVEDRNSVLIAIIPAHGRVSLAGMNLRASDALTVWQARGNARRHFSLRDSGKRVPPTRVGVDGFAQRLDFSLSNLRGPRRLALSNPSDQSLWLVRATGYESVDLPDVREPASVVPTSRLCSAITSASGA